MKCYWTINSSYWPPLRVSQYEVNTSWPPQQKSIVLQYWKPKINSFSYAEKKIMAYVHQLLDQPSQWQTSQQAGPCSVPKFTNTSITVKHLLIKNKNINQSKSSLLIWHYVSYLFLFISYTGKFIMNDDILQKQVLSSTIEFRVSDIVQEFKMFNKSLFLHLPCVINHMAALWEFISVSITNIHSNPW